MENAKTRMFGLNNNQLKIIAMVTMLLDHIGVWFFPEVEIFRILGRISFPIFAYMIAEGCRYTKNRAKHLGLIAAMALAFQVVYFVAMKSLYQGILVTFSLAIITIYAIDELVKSKKITDCLLPVLAIAAVAAFVFVLPVFLKETDFDLDYGLWGILLPVAVYFLPNRLSRVLGMGMLLLIRAIHYTVFPQGTLGILQWFSLVSVLLLALYNGERGRAKMKYVFYIFYPAHLVILYAIEMLLILLKQ
jgi:hypothetical protein